MEFTRLFDILYLQQANHPQPKSFGQKIDGHWVFYSTQEMIDLANNVSLGLLKRGVQRGDKVAIVSYKNCPEWTIVDVALQQIGAISIPLYPTISAREYAYILNEAEVKYAFCGPGDLAQKLREAQKSVPSFLDVFSFARDTAGSTYWEDIFEGGDLSAVQAIKDSIRPEDLATIIYTSGTTGHPKGVMLTHHNILSNVKAVFNLIPVGPGDTVLSFLPLCHIFERTASFTYMLKCVSVAYTGTDNLGGDEGDLKSVRPHFFTTVPRLLEKVYEKIYNKGLALSGAKHKLFFWALSLTDDYDFDQKLGLLQGLKWRIADKLIFSKWREALGGRVRGVTTGAAACPVKIIRVFSAAGIPIREAYGLTETSPGICANRYEPGAALLGSAGPILEEITVKIDSSGGDYRPGEGEILVKGPNVMQGYYKQPEKTAEVFTEDGWFCTGDVGTIVEKNGHKFLKITDRKKELLKTSGGKYVAPAPIENKFKEDFLVEQMMVIGEQRKFVSALIVPAAEALKDWCDKNGVPCQLEKWEQNVTMYRISPETLQHPKVMAAYEEVLQRYNPQFSHIEQIKKFALLPEPWDVSSGELTPTMKLKRRVISERYQQLIDSLYAN